MKKSRILWLIFCFGFTLVASSFIGFLGTILGFFVYFGALFLIASVEREEISAEIRKENAADFEELNKKWK